MCIWSLHLFLLMNLSMSTSAAIRALYLIDARVVGWQALIDGLPEGSLWYLLEQDKDGLAQINAILSGYSGVSALHIYAHGAPGAMLLGSSVLDQLAIGQSSAILGQIGSRLSERADVLVYGCEVGQGSIGQAFIGALAGATGADVAASTDLTGNAAQGGDWQLEAQSGSVEAAPVAVEAFEGVLSSQGAPVVNVLSTTSTRPTLMGQAVLDTGRALEVTVGGITYKSGRDDALSIDSNTSTWSLQLPVALEVGTHLVQASIVAAVAPAAVISGSASADVLQGSNASTASRISGGAGDDRITGASRADTAVFAGNRSDYTIATVGSAITVTDKRTGNSVDGTDTLSNLNLIKFADGLEFVAAAAQRVALSGIESDHVYHVSQSQLINGTTAAEQFIVDKNTSPLILAGEGDVIDLSGSFAGYTYAAKGSQLQISDGTYTVSVNVGGAIKIRTATGTADLSLSFANGPQIKLGNQVVGSSGFDAASAFSDNSSISSNHDTIVSGSSTLTIEQDTSAAADTTAPQILLLEAHSNGGIAGQGTVELTYDSDLGRSAASSPLPASFEVKTGGVANPVSSVAIVGNKLTLTLSNAFGAGSLTVKYTDPTAGNDAHAIQDMSGNDAQGFSSGVVADGYIRGAQMYLDSPTGLIELAGVVTDANGNFLLPADANPNGYALVAVGGINIDTGLPQTTPLKAPAGATTINPLTTLVQAVIAASPSTTAAQAADAVASSLGLTLPAGASLNSYDPLSATDANALGAQKAAAQVATIVALAAANDTSAGNTVIANLATQMNSGSSVSLSDAATVASVLSGTGISAVAQSAAADAASAPRWAAASIPRASPDTTATPAAASCVPSRRAK